VWGMSNAQLSFLATRRRNAWTADPVETPTIDQMLEFVKGHRSCGASCMSSRRLIYPGSSLLAWQKATQRLMELAAALLRKC